MVQELEHLVARRHVDFQAGSAAGLRFAQRLRRSPVAKIARSADDLEMRCGRRAGDAFGRELFGEPRGFTPRLPFGQTLCVLRLAAACATRRRRLAVSVYHPHGQELGRRVLTTRPPK